MKFSILTISMLRRYRNVEELYIASTFARVDGKRNDFLWRRTLLAMLLPDTLRVDNTCIRMKPIDVTEVASTSSV